MRKKEIRIRIKIKSRIKSRKHPPLFSVT